VRLWIDTDVGDNPDDAVALLGAVAHPGIELVGVSTTGGDAERRAVIASTLVDAPIVLGSEPDALAARVRAANLDALLAIGPLTNVARLVTIGVTLPPITLMGGALAPVVHRGAPQSVEYNFVSDPVAASLVVARTDATIVPLDATVAMRIDDGTTDALLSAAPALGPEIESWRARTHLPLVLHDPLALLVCAGEPVATIAPRSLAVDEATGAVRIDPGGAGHAVVTDVDAASAVDRVLRLLG
jgi:inosine-uridine nucleoside N-ribohydrolase